MRTLFRLLSLLLLLLIINLSTILVRQVQQEWAKNSLQEEITPPLPETASPPAERIRLTFAGDLMAHNVNFRMADFADIYREMTPALEEADLAFINLETPVVEGADYETFPRFNVKQEYVQAAIDAGFDIFALANNHSADQGATGVLETLKSLRTLQEKNRSIRPDFAFSGLKGHQRSPLVPVAVNKGPWSVGFISITTFINVWEGQELVYHIDYYRDEEVQQELLTFIRSVDPLYDILVLGVHDGREYEHQPLERKEAFFQELALAGAEVVWGHHSHVLQPWEQITLPGGRGAVILHSMGNFISGQTWNSDPEELEVQRNATGDSCLVSITFEKQAHHGNTAAGTGNSSMEIASVDPYLAFNYRDPEKGMVVRPYGHIIADPEVPKVWKDFYRERKKRLGWFIEGEKAPSETEKEDE